MLQEPEWNAEQGRAGHDHAHTHVAWSSLRCRAQGKCQRHTWCVGGSGRVSISFLHFHYFRMRRAELEVFRFVSLRFLQLFGASACCFVPFSLPSSIFQPPPSSFSLPLPAFSPATIFARRHKKVLEMFNVLIATPLYPPLYYP